MPSRFREILEQQAGGIARFNWEGPFDPNLTGGMVPTGNSAVTDNPGHGGDCEPFTLNRLSTSGGRLNRAYGGASTDNWFNNYLCQWFRQTSNGQHLAVSGVPSEAWRCTNAAQRTNPSRPVVDVPVDVLDVQGRIRDIQGEIGNLLRDPFGRKRYGRVRVTPRQFGASFGNAWLQNEFWIQPMVGDIVKLMYLAPDINRRISEINRLFGGKGLRRTVDHGSWSNQLHDPSVLVQSSYSTINVRMLTRTFVNCKTHIRWAPQSKCALHPSPDQIRRWAVRATMGLTIDLSTLWELTPWSWLADWFGNVGSYLVATRNIIPARLLGVYPMKHTRTEVTFPATQKSESGRLTTITSGRRVREQKLRSIGAVALSAHFPFLNGKQVGILAAIGASRTLPRSGR